jgi:hypothetical protein
MYVYMFAYLYVHISKTILLEKLLQWHEIIENVALETQ